MRGTVAAERSYPESKVRSGDREEISHVQDQERDSEEIPRVQGKRNPSKT